MGMSKFTRGRVKVAEALGKGIGEGEGNAQVPVFFLERELYPFWLSPPHFLVLIDGFGYTPLEERSSDTVNSRHLMILLLPRFVRYFAARDPLHSSGPKNIGEMIQSYRRKKFPS